MTVDSQTEGLYNVSDLSLTKIDFVGIVPAGVTVVILLIPQQLSDIRELIVVTDQDRWMV